MRREWLCKCSQIDASDRQMLVIGIRTGKETMCLPGTGHGVNLDLITMSLDTFPLEM